ncbi:gametogenetin-binding protein 2-like [Amphiura filiformis]|uniref:gametogenetin-binding protein 2-like n=1 Tax=Amphiura filiformis TaxID=82378 RepID=UPI003B2258A7
MELSGFARLVGVCPLAGYVDNPYQFKRRQVPVTVEKSLTMIMELPELEPVAFDFAKGKKSKHSSVDDFFKRSQLLSRDELAASLLIPSKELFGSSLKENVPCVGCRRSMEQLFNKMRDQHLTGAFEPLVITGHSELSLTHHYLYDMRMMHSLLFVYGTKLNELIEALHKNKKNKRCALHSLDNHRAKQISTWIDVWDAMDMSCREEVTLVSAAGLLTTTENYLRKHRFCGECKNKVMRAYNLMIGEVETKDEKGYCASLYEGIRKCPHERHLHLVCDTAYIGGLISRAEPDLNGIRRERHAKTIDIAQEEMLTCLGIYVYNRLNAIWQVLRTEEQTWLLLFHVGVQRLQKAFEMALEAKQGMSKLEQVCEEINEAERAKQERRALKKQKRKARKKNKGMMENGDTAAQKGLSQEIKCECPGEPDENDNKRGLRCNVCDTNPTNKPSKDAHRNLPDKIPPLIPCHNHTEHGPREPVVVCPGETKGGGGANEADDSSGVDCGEDCMISSRESSDVACSEGLCNHDAPGEEVHITSCNGDFSLTKLEEVHINCRSVMSDEEDAAESPRHGGCGEGEAEVIHNPSCPHCDDQGVEVNEQVKKICQCSNERQLRHALGWTSTLTEMLEDHRCSTEEEEPHIPLDEIQQFHKDHQSLERQRQKLRAKLQRRFNRRFQTPGLLSDAYAGPIG